MNENQLSNQIIGLAIKVHKALGPGLYENVYKECLFYELCKSGLFVEKEKPLDLIYDNHTFDCGYRMDLFVENKVVLEIKSVEELSRIHMTQILTYLRFSHTKLGLLINFNVALLSHGIKRVVLNLYSSKPKLLVWAFARFASNRRFLKPIFNRINITINLF